MDSFKSQLSTKHVIMPGKISTDEKIKLSAEIALLTGTILRIVWGKKLVISLLDFQQE